MDADGGEVTVVFVSDEKSYALDQPAEEGFYNDTEGSARVDSDGQPAWSPAGDKIAYASNRAR